MACRWWRSPPTSGISWRQGERSPRSVRMGWICCGGSGSCGPTVVSRGIGRHGSMPVISAGGCRSPASSLARIGARSGVGLVIETGCVVKRTRRRCARIPRRCCARSTTSIVTRAPGRSSTRSRWTGHGAAGGRTRTTIPWSRTATSAAGSTGPRVPSRIPRSVPDERVQRDLRPAAVAPGPGPGRLLRVHRGAGLGVAVGHAGGSGPGAAADHGGPQGNP